MKACPRILFLRIIAEVSPSPRHILYAVCRFAAPQIPHLRINWFLLLLIIRRSAEMHFRIAGLRIIPFLLQLIIRNPAKTRHKTTFLRTK